MTFKTRFTVGRAHWPVYNPNDAVDRLTYVDTTQQITRMLQAGANLKLRNNQGLSGEDFNSPAMPVYSPDVAISQKMINQYQEELKTNAEKRTAEFEAKKKLSEEKSNPQTTTTSPV